MKDYRTIDNKDISGFATGFLGFIRHCIHFIISSIRKNILAAIIIFVLILGAGLYYNYMHSQKQYYQSNMVLMHNGLRRKAIGEILQKINQLVQTKSYDALAAALQLTTLQAEQIINIDAKNIEGAPLAEDVGPGVLQPIYIDVKLKDRGLFTPLQAAIIKYLNANTYQDKRNWFETTRANGKIAFLKHDIRQLDSLISAYPQIILRSRAVTDTGKNNMADLISYKNKLEDRLLTEEESKNFMVTVELLHGFLPAEKPKTDGKSILMLIGLALGGMILGSVLLNAYKHGI